MLGQIFFSLQKFTQKRLGPEAWSRLFAEAGVAPRVYLPLAEYPDEEMIDLVLAASHLANRPVQELLEVFGVDLAADLVGLYRSLIRPEWGALDLIANAEGMIHTLIRQGNPHASPPSLQCLRLSETELQLVYASPRQLCAIAKGIIRGVAAHYREKVSISEHSCMHRGDPCCALLVAIAPKGEAVVLDLADDEAPTLHDTPAPGEVGRSVAEAWTILSDSDSGPIPTGSGGARVAADPKTVFADSAWGGSPAGDGDADVWEAPPRVAQYRVLERLGGGGMGSVYVAEDSMLGRRVALKLMRPDLAAVAKNRERFLREARAMAALQDERIVTIYQVGQHGNRPFLAMPLLRGQTLEQRLSDRGRLPFDEIVRLGREVALGLAGAHEAGLVHRDIKPANVWVEEPHGRIKILDFGLVSAEPGDARVTQAGMILGTPHYMSPEQAAGRPLDGRSDLFSLGVILYRMCAGELPFRGDSVFAVLQAVAVESPRPLHEVDPPVPPGLADLVMSLLAKDPADRPASARVAAEAIMKVGA